MRHDNTLSSYLFLAKDNVPLRPAIDISGITSNYSDIFNSAVMICRCLESLSLSRGERVCIQLPKRLELYTSIFGILFAGGIFVPLDNTSPHKRVATILADCEAKILIMEVKNAAIYFDMDFVNVSEDDVLFIKLINKKVVEYQSYQDLVQSKKDLRFIELQDTSSPDDLAYILYTSGTTGTPKGVVHSNASACAFIEWSVQDAGIKPADRVSQIASVGFDLSIFDIFATFKACATLVPIPESIQLTVGSSFRFITKNAVSICYCVPSFIFRASLKHQADLLSHSKIRKLILAGEKIPKDDLSSLLSVIERNVVIKNWYGPTETNVCMSYTLSSNKWNAEDEVPIGRPCPYTEITLNRCKNAKNSFALSVKSRSLMVGYWSKETGKVNLVESCYDTGDLVSMGPEGNHIFLGRKDRQIKHMGFRIQLEEIESASRQVLGVKDAVSIFVDDTVQPFIGLWIVCMDPINQLSDAQFNYEIRKLLPPHSIPERIHVANNFPRGERGKLDYAEIKNLFLSND